MGRLNWLTTEGLIGFLDLLRCYCRCALAAKSLRLSSFLLARANGRDSCKQVSWATPKRLRAGRAFLQGNKAGHALMAPSAILVSEVPDATVSHQQMRPLSWQFRLPSQWDLLSPLYNPATSVQPATLALYNSLVALVPAPTQNTLFIEDAIAIRREFQSSLSWSALIYCRSQVSFWKVSHGLYLVLRTIIT